MSKHITGHTGLLCLLGSPVAHSVSPEMHNEACDQLGLDYSYLAFDVPEDKMPQAVEGLRTMGARGWNITMPGKNIMCKLADKVSPASEISGACNTIVNDNGVLTFWVAFLGFVFPVGVFKSCALRLESKFGVRSAIGKAWVLALGWAQYWL